MRLRAGLIGLGQMGTNHARVLGQMEDVDLVGIHDPFVEATIAGVVSHPSADALLSSGIDCCIIAAPTDQHQQLCRLAADRGVSVLIEKPLADDHVAAAEMVEWFADQALVGVVGHIERFNPAVVEMQRRLGMGQLGDLYQISTRRQGPFPARIRDIGVILDLATHDIDIAQWVTASRYRTVSAWTAHKSGRTHEDLVVASGRLESGLVVNNQVNWLSASKERLTVITGEGGTLVADTLNVDLYFYENAAAPTDWPAMEVFRGIGEGDMTRYALPRTEPLRNELNAFVAAVRGESEPVVPFVDGADVVRVAEAMIESAPDGQVIQLGD